MELAIRIIIIFFVVLVVGSLIIAFSRDIIRGAQEDINELGEDDIADKDRIISVNGISNQQIASLGVECFQENFPETLTDEICFSVHDTTGIGGVNTTVVEDLINSSFQRNITVDTAGINNNTYAMRIIYKAASSSLKITK